VWRPVAILFLLTTGFYWKLTLTDQYIWFDHSDVVKIELPRMQYQAREIQKRHFPLWAPYTWAGQSLIGQTQPGPLYPLNLLFYAVPLENGYFKTSALNWYYTLIHFLAAWFCYRFARDLGLSPPSAILAGCLFSFGGFVGSTPWPDVFNGAIWTPLVFLHVLRCVRGERPTLNAALAGLFLGIAWLSGHHEIPLLVSCAVALTWIGYGWTQRRLLLLGALQIVITALISAVQLLPTLEFGVLSKRWVGAENAVGWSDTIPYSIHTLYSLPFRALLETFIPNGANYADASPFIGIVAVSLAMIGLGKNRWLVVVGVVATVYALGAFSPFHGILYSLSPTLAKARIPLRAIHLSHLAIAMLAGYGLESLIRREVSKLVAAITACLGALLLGSATHKLSMGVQPDERLILAGITAFVMTAILLKSKGTAVAIFLALVELTPLVPGRHPGEVKFANILRDRKEVVDYLQAQPGLGRVDLDDTDIPEDFGNQHAIRVTQTYTAGVPQNLLLFGWHTPRIQQLLGVTHLVARKPKRPDQAEVFASQSGLKVFRNDGAMPRAWAVHEIAHARNVHELDRYLQDPNFHLAKQTAMMTAPPIVEKCEAADEVKLIREGMDRLTVNANMACTGLLIFNESYYPGWQATVDGAPVAIHEVFGFLRGVVVPKGVHTVDTIYRPNSVKYGAALTLTGFLLTALVWFRF